jgi:hypothetical protein
MGVSGQRHAPAALLPPVPIVKGLQSKEKTSGNFSLGKNDAGSTDKYYIWY